MSLISFNRIGHRILAVVGLTFTLGLGATAWFHVDDQERAVLAQNERTMRMLAETVTQALQSVMLTGHAEIAQAFGERLKQVAGIDEFAILRSDGLEAFKDNKTIVEVNRRLGDKAFQPREAEVEKRLSSPADAAYARVLLTRMPVSYDSVNDKGEEVLTFLAPILNQTACHKCHGQVNQVRGVVRLTTSLDAVMRDIEKTRRASLLVLALALLATLALTGVIVRRTVVGRIEQVTTAMNRVSGGDLGQQLPVSGKDELAQMAGSFNTMSNELLKTYEGLQLEQDKLTTIIHGAREAVVVTDAHGRIVLVNPSAMELLGKSQDRLVADGFMQLFDDPLLMQRWLDDAGASSGPHVQAYNQHVLSVHASRIRNAQGQAVGCAALLRDVTEEKRLEEELRRLSNTDALTALYNRRHFDEALQSELGRARRYELPLSVLMFDIDHFRKLNDKHGHDQGDRMLQAVAATFRGALRNQDCACRYAGEVFVAILPNTDKAGAGSVAERLRKDIERLAVDSMKVTISVGVAEFPDIDAADDAQLVEAADAAMGEAKRSGRNRVCVAAVTELGNAGGGD